MNLDSASGSAPASVPDSVSQEDLARSLRIRPSSDPSSLRLSAAEGYLLSRIDGHTPWRVLREIGGLSPDDVDVCIESWISDGLIEMTFCASSRPPKVLRKAPAQPVSRKPGGIDEALLDPSLELSLETQKRILEFELGLDRSYSAILGVASNASAMDVKRAYRELSREFHPDRYFSKHIGGYVARLTQIFKKVLEGYELLSDPATRAEVQKAEAHAQSKVTAASEPAGSAATGRPAPPKAALTPIERLRQRMPFKLPESMLKERRQRARSFYDAARTWAENGHPLEAASSIRLAIAFDPHDDLYKRTFAEIQGNVADGLVKGLLRDAAGLTDQTDFAAGLKRCEEALLYRPHDPELNDTAAQMALRARDLGLAREYVDRALEHSPNVGRFHRTLARVLHATGDQGHALKELERALELDGTDAEARELMNQWRKKPRQAVQGGRG